MNAISPIDGRYANQVKELQDYFSENALMKYRIKVEVEYLIELAKVLEKPEIILNDNHEEFRCCVHDIDPEEKLTEEEALRELYEDFGDFVCIKEYEEKTHHDVKAVELYIREFMTHPQWVHFGLTSQDVNNTAMPLLLKDGVALVGRHIADLEYVLNGWGERLDDVRMLARTHGQPATPTSMGKQIAVFGERLGNQFEWVYNLPFHAKFGGATGDMNAHKAAYPDIDWYQFAEKFINGLGLVRSYPTTQIEHYDNLARLCQTFTRINTILIDFCRDMWHYISLNYFKIKNAPGQVGSSTMPHKVNPIDFENAEGNLGVANALFNHFAAKLPISRLQRDLTDSTVLRNIGVPFAHSLIAYKAIRRGMDKLVINKVEISRDLQNHWEVVLEGIQTIMRREGDVDAYDKVKQFAMLFPADEQTVGAFIDSLEVSDDVKAELKRLRPETY
jgi:adenylosuccinate lyase